MPAERIQEEIRKPLARSRVRNQVEGDVIVP
jgi:hypothetical protein